MVKVLDGLKTPCDICDRACRKYAQCVSCKKYFANETLYVSRGQKRCLNCTDQEFHQIDFTEPGESYSSN